MSSEELLFLKVMQSLEKWTLFKNSPIYGFHINEMLYPHKYSVLKLCNHPKKYYCQIFSCTVYIIPSEMLFLNFI